MQNGRIKEKNKKDLRNLMANNTKPKKIIIGCHEICGWIALLSKEFEKSGFEVITISPSTKYYKNQNYTLNKDHLARDYFILRTKSKKIGALIHFCYAILRTIFKFLIRKDIYNRLYIHACSYLYKYADIYIHIWDGVEPNDNDLPKFKNNGTKIVSWFVGDDIRFYPAAINEFEINNPYFLEYNKHEIYTPMRKLRLHEKFSDAIFSVPDQSSLALRPYFHLQIPIDLSKYTFKNTGNDIPLIVHIPSAPLLKGTPVFEKVINELFKEGLQFNFKYIIDIPNEEVRKILTEADILLDELYMHGPGMLGMEAMASGCCVVVKHLEASPNCFKPPVVSVTIKTLKDKLRELILNKKLREDLIIKGRSYVEENNKASDVCKLILEKIDSCNYDYYPSYFRDHFEAEQGYDFQKINEFTNMVKEYSWYKQFVKPGKRDKLVF